MFTVASEDPDMHALWRALIVLYEHADHPEKGLELSINLKDHEVFNLLRRQLPGAHGGRFGSVVRKQIIALCEIDTPKALLLFIDCMQELPVFGLRDNFYPDNPLNYEFNTYSFQVDFIVQELEPQPMLLYKVSSVLLLAQLIILLSLFWHPKCYRKH